MSEKSESIADMAFSAFAAILALALVVLMFGGCGSRDCECDCYMYGRTFDDGVRQCVIGLTAMESRIDVLAGRVADLEDCVDDAMAAYGTNLVRRAVSE